MFFSHNDIASQRPAQKETHFNKEMFIKDDDSHNESIQKKKLGLHSERQPISTLMTR